MNAPNDLTRDEYLARCKQRALEYCDRGNAAEALASMFSDLDKRSDTANHAGIRIGFQLMLVGSLSSVAEARRFIEGFP